MRKITRWIGLIAPILLTLTAISSPTAASSMGMGMYAHLNGSNSYPAASGYSEYHGGMMMRGREIEVSVNHIPTLAGKQVTVYVHGTKVGTMSVSRTGHAYRHWATWNGQSVPRCTRGDAVTIKTGGGTLVASGTFRRHDRH